MIVVHQSVGIWMPGASESSLCCYTRGESVC